MSGRRGGSSGWGGGSGRSRWRGGKDGTMRRAPGPVISDLTDVVHGSGSEVTPAGGRRAR